MFKWILLLFLSLSFSAFSQNISTLKDVNFIQEGEVSKLILDFDRPTQAQRLHIKDDQQIILDLTNVKAGKRQLRGIDTSEFSGSTVFVSPYKKPGSKNDLRFAIQLRDNVRSFIETKGQRVILHIENRFGVFTKAKLKKAEENVVESSSSEITTNEKVHIPKSNSLNDILENLTQSGVKRYVGRKISINVNDISYERILNMIGNTSGFNIIIEDEVKKLRPLSINLTNLPWDQVLDTILDLGKLVAVKHGNILTIKTAAKARTERQKELDEENATKTLEPLVTKIFPISYAELTDISKILESYSTKDRGTIQQDKRTRNLIVKDTVEVIERMKRIIETLDSQTPQILIESKIVEVQESYEFRAGLNAGGLKFNYNFSDTATSSSTGTFDLNSAPNKDAATLISSAISIGNYANLNFALDLMEQEAKGKIISSPKVITENNQSATISNTTSRYFRTSSTDTTTGATTSDLEKIDINLSLEVTPKVTNEGAVALSVSISKGSFGLQETDDAPPTVSSEIKTNVLVDNGSTVVIGGVYQTEDTERISGLPFFKDLPLIGWLFKSAYNPKKERNELVIFITPRIVNQEEAGLVNRELGDLGL